MSPRSTFSVDAAIHRRRCRGLLGPLALALAATTGCLLGQVVTEVPDDALSSRRPPALAAWTPAPPRPFSDNPTPRRDPGLLPAIDASGGPLPLEATTIDAQILGPSAAILVRQRFINDRPMKIDAVLSHLLPAEGMPLGYRVRYGDEVIESQSVDPGAASGLCDRAEPADDHLVGLLARDPGRRMSQWLPAIPAGAVIEVELRYLAPVHAREGERELALPLVGETAVRVSAQALGAIDAWASPTHPGLSAEVHGDRLAIAETIRAAPGSSALVLRYRSQADAVRGALFLGPRDEAGSGAFVLEIEPPTLDLDALLGPRELVFVFPRDEERRGHHTEHVAQRRRAIDRILTLLRSGDRVRVLRTGARQSIEGLSSSTPLATREALRADMRRDRWVVHPRSSLAEHLGPTAPGYRRAVFLFADEAGEWSDPDGPALAAAIRGLDPTTRVFGVTLGADTEPADLAALAYVGASEPLRIRRPEDLDAAAESVRAFLDRPLVSDLAIAWGPIEIDRPLRRETLLFAGEPLRLRGYYRAKELPDSILLKGQVGGEPFTEAVAIHQVDAGAELDARAAIDRIDAMIDGEIFPPARYGESELPSIIDFAERHAIASPLTTLAARSERSGGLLGGLAADECERMRSAWRLDDSVYFTGCGLYCYAPLRPEKRRESRLGADPSPASGEDASGLRLAGTPGAESSLMVDGVVIPGAMTPLTPDEGAGAAKGPPPGPPITPSIRVRVGKARAQGKGRARRKDPALGRLADALRGASDTLGACFLDAPRATYRVRRALELRGQRSAEGAIHGFSIAGAEAVPWPIDTCLRDHVTAASAVAGAGEALSFAVPLTVWTQF